jgi:hypothetical protein
VAGPHPCAHHDGRLTRLSVQASAYNTAFVEVWGVVNEDGSVREETAVSLGDAFGPCSAARVAHTTRPLAHTCAGHRPRQLP